MVKKFLLGGIAVFVAWEILDFVIHGMILGATYATLTNVFRPPGEMKLGLMALATLIGAFTFAAVYTWLVNPKSLGAGVKYGLVWGFGSGVMMGYGTFASMPVPYVLALCWFLGTWVEFTIAGLLAGAIIKPASAQT